MATKLMEKADKYFENGNIEQAMNFYLDSLVKEGVNATLYMKLAHCNKILGDDENAIDYYEKSLELDNENHEVLLNYSESLMYLGRYDDAISIISSLINLTEGTGKEIYEVAKSRKNQIQSQKHNYQGGVLMKESRFDEAKEEFLVAIELFPSDRRNYANIGVIFIKNGDADSAIEWMRKAIEVDENYVRGYYNLGTLLIQKAFFKQAIDVFNKALEIEPDGRDSEDIRRNLAVAEQNYEIPKTELLNILSGKMPQISNDYVLELSNSILPEAILSIDFLITKNNKNKVIAYAAKNKYEISIIKDNLEINLL